MCPTQTLLAHGAVEALDAGSLVLLIGASYPVALAVGQHLLGEDLFELAPTVRLYQLHPAVETPGQGLLQEGTPISGSQGRRHHDVRLPGVDVDSREGEDLPEHDAVHLNHLAGTCGGGHRSTPLVLLPLGADDVPFPEYLVDLGHGQVHPVLPFEEAGDLLAAAPGLPLSYGPHPALYDGVHLSLRPWAFLRLLVPVQEGQ